MSASLELVGFTGKSFMVVAGITSKVEGEKTETFMLVVAHHRRA